MHQEEEEEKQQQLNRWRAPWRPLRPNTTNFHSRSRQTLALHCPPSTTSGFLSQCMMKNAEASSAASLTPSTEFPLFQSLPGEIRHLIWDSHFLHVDPPTVHFMTWRSFVSSPSAHLHEPGGVERETTVDGQDITTSRLQEVLMTEEARALLFVCKESRARAMAWAAARDYRLYFRKETQGHIFVRDFDPSRDALYLPFIRPPVYHHLFKVQVPHDPDAEYQDFSRRLQPILTELLAGVAHLAFPAVCLVEDDSIEERSEVFFTAENVKTLTAVFGDWPTALPLHLARGQPNSPGRRPVVEALVQPRWELRPVRNDKMVAKDDFYGGMFWGRGFSVSSHLSRPAFEEEVKEMFLMVEPSWGSGVWPAHIMDPDNEVLKPDLLAARMVFKSIHLLPSFRDRLAPGVHMCTDECEDC